MPGCSFGNCALCQVELLVPSDESAPYFCDYCLLYDDDEPEPHECLECGMEIHIDDVGVCGTCLGIKYADDTDRFL